MSILQLKPVPNSVDVGYSNRYQAFKKHNLIVKLKKLLSRVWDAKGSDRLVVPSDGIWCINVGYVWPEKEK
ncbi:hypothetical protein [Psychromonas sp. SA13A]|uniref:hypothetical protein n=1 Tax=Psychromonas sp. SA13A TaxID=2686346 RepID=UPI0014085E6B|nr:hypothetical protein [Psychromonas sp. SA13A]